MTLFIQVCGVLAVLAIPYAVITIADKAMVKKQRNEARIRERCDDMISRLQRRRAF